MKKYFLFIAGLVLLFNLVASAQVIVDTAVIDPYNIYVKIDDNEFFHKMQADKADSWVFSGGPLENSDGKKRFAKYDVWARTKPNGRNAQFDYSRDMHFAIAYKKKATHIRLHNIKEIELATTSITPQNAGRYKYRVINSDGAELVPWTKASNFRSNKFTTYAYLGKFNCEETTIILVIAEIGNEQKESAYVYFDDTFAPAIIDKISIKYLIGSVVTEPSEWTSGFRILSIKFPQNIQLRMENTPHNERYRVYLKRKYKGEVDTIDVGNNWEKTDLEDKPTMSIDRSFFEEPGVYTIIIQYEVKVDGHLSPVPIGEDTWVHFNVVPLSAMVRLRTLAIIFFSILAISAIIFLIYRRRQNQKLAREEKDKLIATLQLQSVRAQLNPHFIFNALAGIQNLMNKDEVENANKYLSRFARLTRHVLDEAQKELTPIADEVNLLKDYLEMEQMRFGFKFDITVGKDVDQQIEIPAMLLQPFVENAVKHGISALKNEGFIGVNISQAEKDILIKVNDNGGGFVSTQTPGMGIKLCEERVKLLNSIYKNSTILLHINSTPIGVIIGIELKNWL